MTASPSLEGRGAGALGTTFSGPVGLVQLPWAALNRGSLALGLLRALLERAQVPARVVPLHLDLARRIGALRYVQLGERVARFVGEWCFARALFGPERIGDLLEHLRGSESPPRLLLGAEGEALREAALVGVPALLDAVPAVLEAALGAGPWVLGLGCSHDQLLPALAVAERVKRAHPASRVVLGGPQVSGPAAAALLKAFPFVDWIVDGEADGLAAPLFEALRAGRSPSCGGAAPAARRGVLRASPEELVDELDGLPTPSYSEYLQGRPDELSYPIELPVESSRGCRWATRHAPCRFCALDPDRRGWRSKSAARLTAELSELSSQTWVLDLCAADTTLAPAALGALRRLQGQVDLRLFGEVRPVGTLGYVRRLAALGVRQVQPGIESLSTRLLELLGKGTTALGNLGFLKACAAAGVQPNYNLLYGIPGEGDEDHLAVAGLLERIAHLPPPLYLLRVNLVRGSTYALQPERWGIRTLRPAAAHRWLFPAGVVDLERVAYHFEGEVPDVAAPETVDTLLKGLRAWHAALRRGARLTLRRGPDFVRISDLRRPAAPRGMALQGDPARVLLACTDPRSRPRLARELGLAAAPLDAALAHLQELELLHAEGDDVLGLPVPWDSPPVVAPRFGPFNQ